MINKDNYFEKVSTIDPGSLPSGLKKGYEFVKEATENHRTWQFYQKGGAVRQRIDMYFEALSEYLKKAPKTDDTLKKKMEAQDAKSFAIAMMQKPISRGETVQDLVGSPRELHDKNSTLQIDNYKLFVTKLHGHKVFHFFPLQSIYNEALKHREDTGKAVEAYKKLVTKPSGEGDKKPEKKPAQPAKPKRVPIAKPDKVDEVERIEEEVKLIKRYANMHGKEKTDLQLLNLLNAMQKAILEKRIRKTSRFKKEINYMQENLVALINRLRKIPEPGKRIADIKINTDVLAHLQKIGGSEKIRLSVGYIKRYIGIQGKHLNKEKAQKLLQLIKSSYKNGKLKANDLYKDTIKKVSSSLEKFVSVANKKDSLELSEAVLNGINGALGCGCDEKKKDEAKAAEQAGLNVVPKNTVMNSMDFANLKFSALGFTGKWLELIGDPAEGFTAMVFGKPKTGKSYLCVDWAGYLARHHGDTLYVAKEEKLDATLQKKLNDKNVKHPCLYVSDYLPEDLSPYRFIFLDSVNKLDLTPQDLEGLKAQNPGKSFIDIHQTTKDGNFRGANEYQHDVDVVIEVPERGKAVQFGRFNQGGEIPIFEEEEGLCQEAA
ncbi:MAG: hypothetical protein ACXVP0_06430 [Bacteroidia bacterium]